MQANVLSLFCTFYRTEHFKTINMSFTLDYIFLYINWFNFFRLNNLWQQVSCQFCRTFMKTQSKDVKSTIKRVCKIENWASSIKLPPWFPKCSFYQLHNPNTQLSGLWYWRTPQLVKSWPSGLPQWQPIIDLSQRPERHSHHISAATNGLISSLIQSQTGDDLDAADPACHLFLDLSEWSGIFDWWEII